MHLKEQPTFVETDMESKQIIINELSKALNELYKFAGKYYTTNHFTYNLGKEDILRSIVDACINQGYYFGYDKNIGEM